MQDIENLERQIIGNCRIGLHRELAEKNESWDSIYKSRKGALMRARISSIKDIDVPSAYFFKLERKTVQQKQMTFLRCTNGTLMSDSAEMRRLAVQYYAELYGANDCDSDSAADLLQDLPQLSPGQRKKLDADITVEELTAAVKQLSAGRSPGVDGLPAEFYQHFGQIGRAHV